jgi:membrane protein implicated in regulation of membrane protease activity
MGLSEVLSVPILPLIDLLILMSTASLLVGFVLKAIALTTRYRPSLLGFGSLDFVIITAVFLGLALVLAARTWVKLNEPRLQTMRSQRDQRRRRILEEFDELDEPPAPPEAIRAEPR